MSETTNDTLGAYDAASAIINRPGSIKIALTQRAIELGVPYPRFHHFGDAGVDLAAMLEEGKLDIEPGECARVPTGLIIQMPDFNPNDIFVPHGIVHSRTGVALKKRLIPGPQVVDWGYRPEENDPEGLVLGLINHSRERQTVYQGDRVAQIVISLALRPDYAVEQVTAAEIVYKTGGRDGNRFGSTGQ